MSEIKLLHGDCLELLSSIPSNTATLFLMDLPYGVLNKDNKNAYWDKPISLSSLWKEIKRIGKENCAFVFFASGLFTISEPKAHGL